MADNLTELVRCFEEAEQATQSARVDSEQARDYKDGKQYTSAQIAKLNELKQPVVIENLIRPKVDYLCGLERQTRTDPKANPRTMAHEDDANAVTDVLRYVVEDQDYPVKRSAVFDNMLVEGFGGVEVHHHETRQGIDPKVDQIAWDRLFFDPHSSAADFSDASYLGFITWMDADSARAKWQDDAAKAVIDTTVARPLSTATEAYEDKPRWAYWFDTKRRRIRIVTMYKLVDAVWNRVVFTLAGELEPLAPSPYLDEDGNPECALILQSANVDRDNDRYGICRDFITLQDEVNARRRKFLHQINSRPMRISPASGLSPDAARKEFNRPDGILVAEQGEVEDLSRADASMGHFNLLAEAKQAINSVGPNATMQGKSGQDQSGRAILALQQGGMTEMAPLLDNLRHFNVRVYRAIWNRIRQFWQAERWVRVTDDEKTARFVAVNTTKGALAAMKVKAALDKGEIDEQTARQYVTQLQADPAMMQPANVLSDIDADITLEEVADAPSLQIEQFEQLVKLAPMTPPQYLPTMFEMLIEASSLRNKDKLRAIMEKGAQGPDPLAQAMQQLQMAGAQAEVEKTQSEAARNMATAKATEARVHLDAMTGGYQQGVAA